MRLGTLHLALLLTLIVADVALPAATTQPSSDLDELKRQAVADIQKSMRGMPFLGEKNLSDVVRFEIRGGKLHPLTNLPEMPLSWIKLQGLSGWAEVAVRDFGNQKFLQQFSYRDVSAPGVVEVDTEVFSGPTTVQISRGIAVIGDGADMVQLVQAAADGPNSMGLYVQHVSADVRQSQPRHARGASLIDLYLQDPADMNAGVRPIFRLLRQEHVVFAPDPRAAYQVLADLCPIDPAVAAETDATVAKLGADSFDDREAAMQHLRRVGVAAALHLMRHRDPNLTTEQSMRVDLFLAAYEPLNADLAPRLLTDPDFLLDCQFCADATIRRLALEQARRVTGNAMSFDPRLGGPDLADALAKVRPGP